MFTLFKKKEYNKNSNMNTKDKNILDKLVKKILSDDTVEIEEKNKSLFFDDYYFLYTGDLIEIQDPNEIVNRNGFTSFLTVYDFKLDSSYRLDNEAKEMVENMFETIQTGIHTKQKNHELNSKKKFHEYLKNL